MPGLPHREIDTSSWGVKEWRNARLWNVVFLIIWITFYTYAVIDSLPDGHWLFVTAMATFGMAGVVWQLVGLVRITIWLRKQ